MSTSCPSKDLPRMLAMNKFSLQEVTNVIFSIFHDLRQTGKLSIGPDNMIHVTKKQVLAWAKSSAVTAAIAAIANRMEATRTFDPLFNPPEKPPVPAAANFPAVPYNQAPVINPAVTKDDIKEKPVDVITPHHNEIYLPVHLLSSVLLAYAHRLTRTEIASACKILLPAKQEGAAA
jgi:hypothetical protein